MGTKFDELVAEVRRELDDLDIARATLTAIVHAKMRGEAAPAAWDTAIDLVEKWNDDHSVEPPSTIRCAECKAILPLPLGGSEYPVSVECGPVHSVKYNSYVVQIDGARMSVLQFPIASTDSHITVFGSEDAKEPDADVPD